MPLGCRYSLLYSASPIVLVSTFGLDIQDYLRYCVRRMVCVYGVHLQVSFLVFRSHLLFYRCKRIRKRNPLLLNAQPSFGEEEAVGALLLGREVGKHGGAVAGVGDGEVLEFGDGGGVHE